MHAAIWVLVLGLLVLVVLLQDFPWLGIPQTWGRNPGLVTTAVVVALAAMTVLMSVGHVLEELR